MPKKKMNKQIVTRNVADLKPHCRQAELFADLPDHELRQLADDIDKHGLAHPIDILPNNVVVGGHQRLRALRLLHKEKARCRILHDLADADEHEIVQYLIKDNLLRRQLTRLEQARLYRELLKLERGEGVRDGDVRGDLRDHLAKQFGVSGRSMDRWEKLLDCPREVQGAFSRGELPLVTAGKVADLPERMRQQIAKEIRRGENPKYVVQRHLHRDAKHDSEINWGSFKCFLRNLKQNIERLGPHHKSMDMILVKKPDLAVLQGGQELLAGLIRKVAEEFERRQQEQEKLQKAHDEVWAAFTEES